LATARSVADLLPVLEDFGQPQRHRTPPAARKIT
jgi:hypothetical protein